MTLSSLSNSVYRDEPRTRESLQWSDCISRCCNIWRTLCTSYVWSDRVKSMYSVDYSACKWPLCVIDYVVILILFFYLQNKVIDNTNFRNFLELVPEVRELINDFYSRQVGALSFFSAECKVISTYHISFFFPNWIGNRFMKTPHLVE